MKIEKLIVPKGIRYISEWSDYSLEHYQFPHILNKTLTGCGYTEYCITSPFNVILCSPRKILLENKEEQHRGNVYYVRNEIESQTCFEKDFTSINATKAKSISITDLGFSDEEKRARILQLKSNIQHYYSSCQPSPFNPGRPCKILVTYDSFRHVKEALGERISEFYIVIDEFQSVFMDAKFKSSSELEFVNHLQGLNKICFVSATPMLTKYLEMLDEFKHLPYFELDWETLQPGRTIKPNLDVKYCGKKNTIQAEIRKIIEKYRSGVFDVYRYVNNKGLLEEIQSKEAVFYVNSVKDITKAIKLNHLTIDECNILCSNTKENEKLIRSAFGGKARDGITYIGRVPLYDEPRKMFTFCTRTVYLGADFYSDNAKSYIFSNANIDCLSVDISMDLPQILGRQRLDCNPWKNSASLYVVLRYKEGGKQEFIDYMNEKDKQTKNLLQAYSESSSDEIKGSLAHNYEKVAKAYNYKDDYVAVNRHSGSQLVPVLNNLMRIAELRTFEIQEYDYKDRFSVFSNLGKSNLVISSKDRIDVTIWKFNHEFTTFVDKMKYLCSQKENLSNEEYNAILGLVPIEYKNYIITLGVDRIKANSYKGADCNKEFNRVLLQQNSSLLRTNIQLSFVEGERYTKTEIKEKLKEVYLNSNYTATPKASDLEQWFEIKSCKIQNKQTGKRDHGFEIIKKKGD